MIRQIGRSLGCRRDASRHTRREGSRHLPTGLALLSLLLIAGILHQHGRSAQAAPPLALLLPRPAQLARSRIQRELDWTRIRKDGAGYVQVFSDGGRAEL